MIAKTRIMTVAEYFAFDEASEIRNEFIDGEIIPMPGGTGIHNILVGHATIAIGNALRERDCAVYGSQMRVQVDATKYVYPDVSVVCGRAEYADARRLVLLNPIFVAEVTSPTSIVMDHVDKLEFYGAVPSIQGYLILDQERVFATWHSRAGQSWQTRQYSDLGDVIPLEPLGAELSLAEVYRRAELDQ